MTLDPADATSLAGALGPRAGSLEGRLVGWTDSTVTVAVQTITRVGGAEESWNGDATVLPLRAVERVERRRMDAVRTSLVAAGVVAAALLAGRVSSEGPVVTSGGTTPASPQ